MKVWILTQEYNDYGQYGEYFEEVYSEKPTIEQMKIATELEDEYCKWLLESGGGRENPFERWPCSWYHLRQVDCK